jgi:hypothetical protein
MAKDGDKTEQASEEPVVQSYDGESLENPTTQVETTTVEQPNSAESTPEPAPDTKNQPKVKNTKKASRYFGINVYLIAFGLLIVLGGLVTAIAIIQNRSDNNKSSNIPTQSLSQNQLQQLANSDVSVGNSSDVLNVAANAVFGNQVLIRQDLDVGGTIKVAGSLSLPGITVSGNSDFEQIQTSKLGVSGSTTLNGQLTVGQGLNVSGPAAFNGTVSVGNITIQNLTLNGALTLDHHIVAGGTAPSRSQGDALGSGGTVSLSGSDTAGTININTGGSPTAGCFVTVSFAQTFSSTPIVVVSPVDLGAAGISYYLTRSTTNFSLCTTSTPPSNQSFSFDYVALD